MTEKELVQLAFEARERAYTPYSHFKVGAALLAQDKTVYLGCNIENVSYTPTNCAERTAFFKAVSEGNYDFTDIAVVGGRDDATGTGLCAPCGVCRQVMMEFCNPETFRIHLGWRNDAGEIFWETRKLKEILPLGFGPDNLIKE